METFGERMKWAREQRGMSQPDLAHAMGVAPMTISKWERGAMDPGSTKLRTISALLGVSADWLLNGGPLSQADGQAAAEVPFWAEFLANYSRASELTDEELLDIRALAARRMKRGSWSDLALVAEIVLRDRPSRHFEAKKGKGET